MFRVLFILFVIVPIIEIAVLMQVGSLIGAWPTVAIVVITAWLGAKNVKAQGIATIQNLQTKMAVGEEPSQEIVAGLLLLVAGVLLVTPGFVTDAFGLSLLIPQVRNGLVASVQQHLATQTVQGMQGMGGASFTYRQQSHHASGQPHGFEQHTDPFDKARTKTSNVEQGNTIEGEFERKD
ncbi:FxsA family protein [Thalassotalea euphylliae]|uniref:FxsA family protein n=1 Tax=Thalassotalea euphylliae TaxID=1655234 RepID=A0A3E0U3W0_9GAMM|nr:FxsA family protein [Thalassotalea euphylliae]REL31628.1 FxsA family protein [Thalassotalea euphylliae]